MMTRPGALGITSKDNCPSVFPSFRRRCSFAPSMALALTPRLLRRGLELFALISLAGVGGLLFYGNNFQAFAQALDRKSTRLNSSHLVISYAVFCLKKKKIEVDRIVPLRAD